MRDPISLNSLILMDVSVSTRIIMKVLNAFRTISLLPGLILCSVRSKLSSIFSLECLIVYNFLRFKIINTLWIANNFLYEIVL